MNNRPKVLFVVHNNVSSQSFGGIESYLNSLKKCIDNEYELYFYLPTLEGGEARGVSLISSDGKIIKSIFFNSGYTNWQLSCPEREIALVKILEEFNFSLVHFHHLAGHPPAIVKTVKQFGIPSVFTFHDFYSLCHVSNLINSEGVYCHPDRISLSDCDDCLNKKYSILPACQGTRREFWNSLFADIDGLIFNTQGGWSLASSIYSNIAKHPNVVLLPVAIEKLRERKPIIKSKNSLKIAILGNFLEHKGAKYILEAIENLRNENISFHFFGEVEEVYRDKLKSDMSSNIFLYGRHPPGELPEALFSCHLSVHASICPETYSLALSEAWAAGLVPIVSDVGALGERVSHNLNGLKIKVGSTKDLVNTIKLICSDKNILNRNTRAISTLPISWMDDHSKGIISFYKKIVMDDRNIKNNFLLPKNLRSKNWAFFEGNDMKNHSVSYIYKMIIKFKSKIKVAFE